MSRAWKPGDVAMVNDHTQPSAPWLRATCVSAGVLGDSVWVLPNGLKVWGSVTQARPLVVIDPEDREQVTQFAELYDAAMSRLFPEFHGAAISIEDDDAIMQAALREFADPKPPKPAEPTGLGAVVETVDEVRVIRVSTKVLNPWQVETTGSMWSWHEIDAVRVLSEGVQS